MTIQKKNRKIHFICKNNNKYFHNFRQKNCINITSVCLTYDKDIFCKKTNSDNENKSLYFNLFSLAYCISQTHDPKKLINLKEDNDASILSMMNVLKFYNNEVIPS